METNIDFLREQCQDDDEFMKIMIDTFFENSDDYVEKIKKSATEKNWEDLQRASHAFLSSLTIVGAVELSALVRQIEQSAKFDKNLNDLEAWVDEATSRVDTVIEELREARKKLST